METVRKQQMAELQNGFDLSVERHVGGGESVDGEFLADGIGEMEEAADVVVLIVAGEEAFRFGLRKAQRGERDGLAKIANARAIEFDKFAERHHWSAASGFSAHGILQSGVYCEAEKKRRI
jgi:hypothetical protein